MTFFSDRDEAFEAMRSRNRSLAKDNPDMWVLTPGPNNDFAVIDIPTAIEMDVPYEWAV